MAMLRISGTPNIQPLPGAASVALVANGMVTLASGVLAKSSSTDLNLAGISLETRASTDADFATARPVLVDMLSSTDVLLCDVVGTLTAAMVGTFMDLSSTTGINVDAATNSATEGNFLCVGFISATKGYFVLAGSMLTRPSA